MQMHAWKSAARQILVRPLLLVVVLVGVCQFSFLTPTAFAQTMSVIPVTQCNEMSLRNAIASAHNGDTITFRCSGDIKLTSTLSFPSPNNPSLTNLTIDGNGQVVQLDGNNAVQVFTVNAPMTLTLKRLTVIKGGGFNSGGLSNGGGTVTIDASTFASNTARGDGGGLFNGGGTVMITNSTFASNTAGTSTGGGLFNEIGTVTITNSTFASNTASTFGGGLFNGGTVTITNSTFANNSAGEGGGGLFNGGDTMTVGTTIVAQNTVGNCFGTITDQGYNLESGTDCHFTAQTDVQNTDPQFDGGLADHGGPTQTIALSRTSPAVNRVPVNLFEDETCSLLGGIDQRGMPRPDPVLLVTPELSCDIGAYELQDG